jgi:pimeloyl-ACP methyl ester carboxylesterase
MLIRGANSDVLSAATVSAMRARWPGIETVEIPDQGHAPLLVEDEIIQKIGAFVADCDRTDSRRLESETPGGTPAGG